MEQLHTDPTDSADTTDKPGEESLSAYVHRMETDENLRKLAVKLEDDLKKPVVNEYSKTSTQEMSADLSFEKFDKKRRQRGGQ